MDSIHGHTVLGCLADAAVPLSLGEIEAAVAHAGSAGRTFHVCDREGLDLAELLVLLEARGKIWRVGACYSSERSRICADPG